MRIHMFSFWLLNRFNGWWKKWDIFPIISIIMNKRHRNCPPNVFWGEGVRVYLHYVCSMDKTFLSLYARNLLHICYISGCVCVCAFRLHSYYATHSAFIKHTTMCQPICPNFLIHRWWLCVWFFSFLVWGQICPMKIQEEH